MNINWHQLTYFISHFIRAKRRGHGVHSPFAFQLAEEVFYNQHSFYAFEKLKQIRQHLLTNKQVLSVNDFGAGSKKLKSNQRSVKRIASVGISSQKQSEILYKLIHFLNLQSCLELGTSLGLNALYMASVSKHVHVMSIEASESLYEFAKKLAHDNKYHTIQFVNATFDEALPPLLNENKSFDFIYVDGNHTYEASTRYFNWILEKLNKNTVIVFDDIYWSQGMTKAWNEIKANPKVKLSIDAFYMGFLFFKDEIKEKIEYKFYI